MKDFFIYIEKFSTNNFNNWSINVGDEQVRNMNDESISRLSSEQIKTINDVAGVLLDAFGYPRL